MWLGVIAVCSAFTVPNFRSTCEPEYSPYFVYTDPVYKTESECMQSMIDFAIKDEITIRFRSVPSTSMLKIQIRCERETRKVKGY